MSAHDELPRDHPGGPCVRDLSACWIDGAGRVRIMRALVADRQRVPARDCGTAIIEDQRR